MSLSITSSIIEGKYLSMDEIKEIIFCTPGFFLCQTAGCSQDIISPETLKEKLWGKKEDSRFVSANGITLSYTDSGKGEPILLIHGMRDCKDIFAPLVPELKKNHRVIAIDLRGHGYSDKPSDEYSTALLAADIAALLKTMNLSSVTIAGHSLGASLALEVYEQNRDLVKKLVLMGASVAEEHEGYRPVDPVALIKDKTREKHSKVLDMLARKFFAARGPGEISPVRAGIREKAMLCWMMFPEEVVLQLVQMKRTALAAGLPSVAVPVLLLAGEEDVVGGPAQAENICGKVQDATVSVFKGCGHYMFLEQAQKTVESIFTFVTA
jgi:3-oxoadipate enol-lactonase